MDAISLSKVAEGKKVKVIQIFDEKIKKKMENMGIRIGKELVKIASSPLKGAITVQINNRYVAIGFGAAEKIIVEELS